MEVNILFSSSGLLARRLGANILVAASSVSACTSQVSHLVSLSAVVCWFGRALGFSSKRHGLQLAPLACPHA